MRAVLPVVLLAASTSTASALDVSLSRARLSPGEGQEAIVYGLEAGARFRAAWLDPAGRVRGSWDLRAGRGGVGRVGFRTGGALAGRHRVVAWHADSRPADGAQADFEVLPGEAPAYLTVLDSSDTDRKRAEDLARGLGVGALALSGPDAPAAPLGWVVRVLEGGPALLELDEDDLRARRTAYGRSPADALLARPACLRDRAWLVHVWRWAWPRVESAERARPWLWELGRDVRLADDDGALDFCRSPHCMRAFVSELRRRGDDLESLNGRWGTAFESWTEVRPPTTRETVEALRAPGVDIEGMGARLAGWSDHRGFLDRTWVGMLGEFRELLRSVAGRACAGLGGVRLPGIFTGADPTRLLGAIDWVDVAPEPLDLALARSFAPRRCRQLTRLGPEDPAEALFRGLASGHRGAVLVPAKAPPREESEGAPVEGGEPPAVDGWRGLPDALGAIEGGLGELFALSTWEPDPVVVLYSRKSVRVEWAVRAANGQPPRAGAALAAWASILSDLGLAARFVEADGLARALRSGKVRALVLPRAYVLGRPECAEIDRFAAGGGLVVADASAGVFDDGFRPGPAPEIESVFGVTREPEPGSDAKEPEGEIVFGGTDLPGAYIDGVEAPFIDFAEPNLRAVASYPLARRGRSVGLLTNPYGHGRGVYLNVGLEGYADERLSARGASMRRLVKNVLELGRVDPRVRLVANGADLEGCERVVRRIDEVEIVTLHRDAGLGGEDVAAEMVFARPAFCFDALTGVLIGTEARVRVKLGTGPRVFVRLPYDVERVSLKVSERGDVVRYRGIVVTPIDLAGTHVIRREVLDAEGEPVPGMAATIVADRGVFKGSITFAGNEPAGDYRLAFRDVATGVEAELAIRRDPHPLAAEFPLDGGPSADSGPARAAE